MATESGYVLGNIRKWAVRGNRKKDWIRVGRRGTWSENFCDFWISDVVASRLIPHMTSFQRFRFFRGFWSSRDPINWIFEKCGLLYVKSFVLAWRTRKSELNYSEVHGILEKTRFWIFSKKFWINFENLSSRSRNSLFFKFRALLEVIWHPSCLYSEVFIL